MKFSQRMRQLLMLVKTGKNSHNKFKIVLLCFASYLRRKSPEILKKHYDNLTQAILFESDVKFFVGTIYDFFVFSSLWEQELRVLFDFRVGMNFLDVGAHIGKYSLRAASKVGNMGRVIAIEPNRDNFNVLVRNIGANRFENCVALNVAAYNTDTSLVLYRGPDSARHSVRQDFGMGWHRIKARKLDGVLKELNIDRVDLVKIDVEGAELEVLQGLEQTLTQQNPIIVMEILTSEKDKVLSYMNSLSYEAQLRHVFLPFHGGLSYYLFSKSTG